MLLIPFLLLIITEILIWLLRKRHLRSHWFVAALGALFIWVSTYLLGDQLPIELEFSIWEPQIILRTSLLFKLDQITWPLFMTCSAVIIVITMTLPSRNIVIPVRERIETFIYLFLTSAAILAGNILSVMTMWMLMDVFIFSLGMRRMHHEEGGSDFVRWFAKNILSIFLLLIAGVLEMSIGGSLHFREQMTGASILLATFSCLLRMPIYSISKHVHQIGWSDPGNMSIVDLFPALTGFSVLGHVFLNGLPVGAIAWVRVIGVICLAYGLIQSFLWTRTRRTDLVLSLGIFGIGILASSYGFGDAGTMISMMGVLNVALHLTFDVLAIHESWHTVVPILFIAMLAGLPGTLGGLLGSRTIDEIMASGEVSIAIIVWLGMGIVSGSYLSSAVLRPQDWKNSENLTRINYAAGLMILALNAILIGVELSRDITLKGLLFFFSVAFVAGIVYYSINKMNVEKIWGTVDKLRFPQVKSIYDFLRPVGDSFLGILGGIGSIFESDTGMLWTLVILQLLILTLGKLGI